MANEDKTLRYPGGLQQGERFRWIQSLQDIIDNNEFPNGLATVVAYARIVDPNRVLAHRFEAQPLNANDTDVTFIMGGSVSENWTVGAYYPMQIMFSDGTDTGKVITRTINIRVKEGFVRLPTTGLGTGSYDEGAYSPQYNTGTGAGGTI